MKHCETCGSELGDDPPFAVCPRCLFERALDTEGRSRTPPQTAGGPSVLRQTIAPGLFARKDFFKKYEILERVAQGGQGDVWKVWDVELRRSIAMKRLGDAALASEPAIYRFLAEAQIASQLDHPGILPIFDVGLDGDGRPFYTTQLLPGTTLGDVWRKVHQRADPEWTINRALEMLLRICDVMAHAHNQGVIHRDLKPSNVLVGSFGDVRVIDWGSAHVLEAARREFEETFVPLNRAVIQTDRGEAMWASPGSPLATANSGQPITVLFMPPEILLGQTGQLGPETDVYSLGVMLYELLAGRPPYSRSDGTLPDRTALQESIVRGSPAPVRSLNHAISRDLAAICQKAMAHSKSDRYATMLELAGDLRAVLENRPVRARRPGPFLKIQKWAQRNISYVLLGGASLMVVCVVLSVSRNLKIERDVARQVTALRSAELAARSGRWHETLQYWDEAEAAGYNNSIYLDLQRAEAWTVLNEPCRSGALLQRLAKRSNLGDQRGVVLLRLGEHELFDTKTFDRGVQHVRDAIGAGLNGADLAFARGLLAESTPESLDSFRQTLQLNPYHYGAHLHSLGLEFMLGRHAELEAHVRLFQVLFPDDPSSFFIEAADFAARGRLADAEGCLTSFRSSLKTNLWQRLDSSLRLMADAAEYYDVNTLLGEHPFDKAKLDRLVAQAGSIILAANMPDPANPQSRYRMPELPCVHNGLREGLEALQSLALPLFKDLDPVIQKIKSSWEHHPEALIPFRAGTLLDLRQPSEGPKSFPLLAVQAELFQMAANSPSIMPGIERCARFLATKAQFELAHSPNINYLSARVSCLDNIRVVAFSDATSGTECRAYFDFACEFDALDLARVLLDKLERQRTGDTGVLRDRIRLEIAVGAFGTALGLIDKMLAENPDDQSAREQRQIALQKLDQLERSVPPSTDKLQDPAVK